MQYLYTSVTFTFLGKIERAALENDKERILSLGLEPEQADRIAALRAGDVFKLSRIFQIINIKLDEDLLLIAFNKAGEGDFVQHDIEDANITNELLRMLSYEAVQSVNHEYISQEFGLSHSTIAQLSKLTLIDIARIVKTGIHFYTVSADEWRLPMALDFIEEQHREEENINKLIEADASYPMVHALTGMQKKPFQTIRKNMGLLQSSSTGGAPKQLDQEQSHIAYKAWQDSEGLPIVDRCLAVHEAVNVGLRHLWPRIEEFRRHETGEEVTIL